ncbi:MAG: hypothetical protein ACPGSB_06030 [Opitutales bacterium]
MKANNQNLVEQVGGLEAIKVLAVNYIQNFYGVGVSWSGVSQSQRTAGYVIAHEVLHAMKLRHRKGVVTENLDGLEDKYRRPAGTNIMDYGGGIDLDLLQALIARGSPLLQ